MNNLKRLRLQNNLTLQELSKKVNIVASTLSYLENGKRQFTQEHLEILSKFFDCTTDYLLGKAISPNGKLYNVNVADSDGTITKIQWELLDATKGLTIEDMQKINEYIEFLKTRKDK